MLEGLWIEPSMRVSNLSFIVGVRKQFSLNNGHTDRHGDSEDVLGRTQSISSRT